MLGHLDGQNDVVDFVTIASSGDTALSTYLCREVDACTGSFNTGLALYLEVYDQNRQLIADSFAPSSTGHYIDFAVSSGLIYYVAVRPYETAPPTNYRLIITD